MRIVFLNPSARWVELEVALLDVLATLREAAPDWTLELIISGDGPVAAKAAALGVVTTVLPFPGSLSRLGDASLAGPNRNGSNRLHLFGS